MTYSKKVDLAVLTAILISLVGVIQLHLIPVLLGGLLVYHLVEFGARNLGKLGVILFNGKVFLVAILAVLVIAAFGLATMEFLKAINKGPESFVILLQKMADVIDTGRAYLPAWAQQYLPANIEDWQLKASLWLRENAIHVSIVGKEAGIVFIHLIIGMVIGGMIALNPGFQEFKGPVSKALSDRIDMLGNAFKRIVFSQVRISALNTFMTSIFLVIILPLMGTHLPLTSTMIAVTFFAGLLPIIGNLISNTVITLIALSVSPMVAVASLVYLVVIHKLEYFMNAHIIGTQIRARAWEILIAMLVMESAFGLNGLLAAPIYYAYLKDELASRKLI
ncbi:MAG: hypothetical protein WBK77_01405 [Alphaproteobacteria bacterium]